MLKKLMSKLRRTLFPTAFDEAISRWVADDGDRTLRMNYPLSSTSVVFDLGGYEGQWASDIYGRYRSTLYIFEPVKLFYKKIENRFELNDDVNVYNYGLGGDDAELTISVSEDASSAFSKGSDKEVMIIRAFDKFVKENEINFIDLMKINIEGGEYELLESIVKSDFIHKIRNLQIQFHNFLPGSDARMQAIQLSLRSTHEITYQYFPYVWENWKLIKE